MRTRTRFGRYIRRSREAAGIAVNELARRARIEGGTLSRIERGLLDPRLSTILKISRGLKRPPREFMSEFFDSN